MLNRRLRFEFRKRLAAFLPLRTWILLHFLYHSVDLVLGDRSDGSPGDEDYVVEIKDQEVGRESDDDCNNSQRGEAENAIIDAPDGLWGRSKRKIDNRR